VVRLAAGHRPGAVSGDLPHPLDNLVWLALTGPHAALAEGAELARRYPADVAPFAALATPTSPDGWEQLGGVVGSRAIAVLLGPPVEPPPAWTLVGGGVGVQMVAPPADPAWPVGGERLTHEDVPEMLALVAAAEPGPFGPRTIELGTYLGIRQDGRLVAMAGERFRGGGYTEISAVCTDAASRGRGLATQLVLALVTLITARGETACLHAVATNVTAIRLYERLGFTVRREVEVALLRAP